MLLVVAIAVTAAACASQGVLDVALSKNPKGALQGIAKSKVETYKRNPQELVADFDRLKADLTRLYSHLKQESEKQWGPDDGTALPAPKRYVKYTEQYRNRISVDYERSTIRIEHIQEPSVAAKIRGAVVIALLTPQDPKSADVFSDTVPTLDGKPFLQNLVLDQNRRVMATRQDVERFADFLVANRLQVRALSVRGSQVNVTYTQFDMIGAEQDRAAPPPVKPRVTPTRPVIDRSPDARADDRADPNRYAAADKIAPNFLPIVNKYAQSTGVDPALIFAIIYQESRFNPHAVSVAEAYGMMQLVPRSGGMEAFRKAKGESAQPTPEYLMDPENNIELGATYVS
ncbi:MAG: murein transglycosylase domain-containing protein, partial [Acidobacteriota bacterium]